MAKIGRLWAGRVFGTNTGNVSAELDSEDGKTSGLLRFMDERFGLVLYKVQGTFDGTSLSVKGDATQSPAGIENGTITIDGSLAPDGSLRGRWSSTLGTGGTFILNPHDAAIHPSSSAPNTLPEQLHSATRTLGVVRVYADDVRELIEIVKRDFAQGQIVVTYRQVGNEISKYANDFVSDIPSLGNLTYLRIQIQEPDAYGVTRLASIELNADGVNIARVQGVQESWVIGKVEGLANQLRKYQKTLPTAFRRFGLNINSLIVLFALLVLPDLTLGRRAIFGVIIIAVLLSIKALHTRYIPNARILLNASAPGFLGRAWPLMLSWLFGIVASIISAAAYGILKGDLKLPSWISDVANLFH